MPKTLEDLKEDKADLEAHIRDEIQAFQKEYEVQIDRIRLRSHEAINATDYITGVEIEITL